MKYQFKLSDQILEGKEIESVLAPVGDQKLNNKDKKDLSEFNEQNQEDEEKCQNRNYEN